MYQQPMQARALFLLVFVAATLLAAVLLLRGRSVRPGAEGAVEPPRRQGAPIGGFSQSLFNFAPAASGKQADWQEAAATLTLSDPADQTRGSWTCDVVIGMPQRAETWGEISPDYAAYAAATAASDAASAVMGRPIGDAAQDFCQTWRAEMQRVLDGIKGLGAKVNGPS